MTTIDNLYRLRKITISIDIHNFQTKIIDFIFCQTRILLLWNTYQRFVKRHKVKTIWTKLNVNGFNIFISGSSSKLLSKEIATSLRGRTLSYLILPFSFKEFINIKNLKFDLEKLSSKDRSILLNLMNEYLEFGGFPEVVLEKEIDDKLKTIAEYFDLVLYKDIVERNNLKTPS